MGQGMIFKKYIYLVIAPFKVYTNKFYFIWVKRGNVYLGTNHVLSELSLLSDVGVGDGGDELKVGGLEGILVNVDSHLRRVNERVL
jgi:hypothetical protein